MKPAFRTACYALLALLALCLTPLAASAEAEEPSASEVMSQPLDGSSQAAFDAGVARVKAEATAEEVGLFQRALGMIRAYDLGIRSNPSLLPQRLNGKTPQEVIDLAKERWKL